MQGRRPVESGRACSFGGPPQTNFRDRPPLILSDPYIPPSMLRYLLSVLSVGLLAVATTSCGSDMASNFQQTPQAFGKINSVNIIADSTLWNNGASDSIAYFLQSPYIILPQPEPIFDVRHLVPYDLLKNPTLTELRNYVVLADLSDEYSKTTEMVVGDLSDAKIQQVKEEGFGTAVALNKWAKGQQLIYVMGRDRQELMDGLSNAYPAIVRRLDESEAERVKVTAYFRGVNRQLGALMAARSGVTIDVPGGYEEVPVDSDKFAWLRKEIRNGSINIMATRVPYLDQAQLSKAGLKAIRDSIGREFISSTLDSTYMRINDEDLPLFTETTEVNGAFAIEGRGIWEMENDFLGGPFFSYLINNEGARELVLIDGFVLAPGEKKREHMQEIVEVLKTATVGK